MSRPFETPQDAEDAFYDAIEEKNLQAMLAVWDDSDETACLLPMQALAQGSEQLRQAWEPLLEGDFSLDIAVTHVHWIELGDIAIHYIQETAKVAGQTQSPPPVYATNIYRKKPAGWSMILHQNSPAPPPPGMGGRIVA